MTYSMIMIIVSKMTKYVDYRVDEYDTTYRGTEPHYDILYNREILSAHCM